MGNDGGVVAVKRKFMRHANQKTKNEKRDEEERRKERVHSCAVSGEPLQEPIVACELGNLYNKQALLEHLLVKTIPEKFQHISSLKDVVTCRFSKSDATATSEAAFVCPVTMVEFNGKQPFVVVWSCGCVVSERATKEVQTTECLVCGASIEGATIVALLPAEELYADAQKKLLERKAAEKQLKKDGKKKGDKKRQERQEDHGTSDRKEKKRKRENESAVSRGAGEKRLGGGATTSIAQEATAAIEEAKSTNKVFASLFSKDKNAKKNANDLLMTVGGMRYGLS